MRIASLGVGLLLLPLLPANLNLALAAQSLDSAGIAKEAMPAVVLIKGMAAEGDRFGTGFIISSDGKIATNLHVIEDLRQADMLWLNKFAT